MRSLRFLSTKYWSVVALPSLTSCVHCSSGILMPNALSMANAISRKSRLSMPRSLMAWLSGLIVSRGMSQVSEMMLATVSKVADEEEGEDEEMVCPGSVMRFAPALTCLRLWVGPPAARIPPAEVSRRYSEDVAQVQWRS